MIEYTQKYKLFRWSDFWQSPTFFILRTGWYISITKIFCVKNNTIVLEIVVHKNVSLYSYQTQGVQSVSMSGIFTLI